MIKFRFLNDDFKDYIDYNSDNLFSRVSMNDELPFRNAYCKEYLQSIGLEFHNDDVYSVYLGSGTRYCILELPDTSLKTLFVLVMSVAGMYVTCESIRGISESDMKYLANLPYDILLTADINTYRLYNVLKDLNFGSFDFTVENYIINDRPETVFVKKRLDIDWCIPLRDNIYIGSNGDYLLHVNYFLYYIKYNWKENLSDLFEYAERCLKCQEIIDIRKNCSVVDLFNELGLELPYMTTLNKLNDWKESGKISKDIWGTLIDEANNSGDYEKYLRYKNYIVDCSIRDYSCNSGNNIGALISISKMDNGEYILTERSVMMLDEDNFHYMLSGYINTMDACIDSEEWNIEVVVDVESYIASSSDLDKILYGFYHCGKEVRVMDKYDTMRLLSEKLREAVESGNYVVRYD